MEKFLVKIFWIVGALLIVLGTLSFYVRYQTLKYDLRPETGDVLKIE